MRNKIALFLCLAAMLATACERDPLEDQNKAMQLVSPKEINDDLPLDGLIAGLLDQITWMAKKDRDLQFGPYIHSSSLYIEGMQEFLTFLASQPTPEQLNTYVREKFRWYEVYGDQKWGEVKLTSYYLPEINGSPTKTEEYTEPFLARPDDLVIIQTKKFWEPIKDIGTMRGRINPDDSRRIVPYHSRADIDGGALDVPKLALAWVHPVDAFTAHIQGSVNVRMANDSVLRLGYADQNGHPYVAIGKFLLDLIPREEMSMEKIEEHVRQMPPDEQREFLQQNPSYIFFRKLDGPAVTANTTPVVDGRTIATDAKWFPKGTLAVLTFTKPDGTKVSRLVLDQDTGGAIKGGGRVDLFWGQGEEAGKVAGTIHQQARLHYLVPKLEKIRIP